jgi:Bifunctional DNA primase/polymerase, N-terminal
MIEIAKKYYDLGFSCIPVNAKKEPANDVKGFTESMQIPDKQFKNAYGIAIVCGKFSRNLEVLDIDTKYDLTGTLYQDFKRAINAADPNLLKKLVVEQTPTGGYHFIFRCSPNLKNLKLARRPTTEEERKKSPNAKVNVLLETRGEGGYFVCAPTKGYSLIYGSFDAISEITQSERDILYETARTFNTYYKEAQVIYPNTSKVYKTKTPIDDFNSRGNAIELLEKHGWTVVSSNNNMIHLKRPGESDSKQSASFFTDNNLFYVFSTSTEFDTEKCYNPAAIFCILEAGGDWHKCAKLLSDLGYGEKLVKIDEVKIEAETDDYTFVIDKDEIEKYIDDTVNNRHIMGKDWGIPLLDSHFKYKAGSFNVINGHQNVGKSTFLWYLACVSAMTLGLKWIIYSPENKAGYISRKIMEFYCRKVISKITDHERRLALDWIYDHFVIIGDKEYFSYTDIIKASEKTLALRHFDCLLIDPYNALKIETAEFRSLGGHEYHYQAASLFRIFCKRYNVAMYLNTHSVTGAQRTKDKDGALIAPHMSDIEGGGKWGNKADDFITIHRHVGNPVTGKLTQVLVRKIKEIETGGKVTLQAEPLLFSFEDYCRFVSADGVDAVALIKGIKEQQHSTRRLTPPKEEPDDPESWQYLYDHKP